MTTRLAPSVLTASTAFLAVLLAVPAAAQLARWDQERVTKIAIEIREKTTALYDTFYREPVPTVGSVKASSYFKLKQLVRRIKREASQLADGLEKGKGREETQPIYDNLMAMVRDAQEEARRSFTSESILASATTAGDALRRIAPYYDPEAARNPVREAEEAGKGD
jgi:hypothetical protein